MAALTVDFRKHSGPTPADDTAAQIITDCGNVTLDFKRHGFCASPLFLQTLGPWLPNEMQNVLSSEKRKLNHWATVQLFFSLPQVRCFWRCFCFRSGLVALFLKMSERGDSWCTPASVHSFWSSPKCFNRLCFTVFCGTVTPLMTLCDTPLCGGCQWSSSGSLPSQQCSPLLWFQRTRDTHNLYCMDGHLLKLKCIYFYVYTLSVHHNGVPVECSFLV